MEGIMLFYRMIYADKCRLEKISHPDRLLFVIDEAPAALLHITGTFQFL
jgi:hypothetical protein